MLGVFFAIPSISYITNECPIMNFNFGLQSVLDFQELKEEEARTICEQLQHKLALHNAVLAQLEENMKEAQEHLYSNLVSANMLWLEEQYIQSLQADIDAGLKHKEKIEEELKKQQDIVLELAKKTKSIDMLKTKRKEGYLQEENNKEQKQLDAMTTMRFKHETH